MKHHKGKFGKKVRQILAQKRLSQGDLAEAIGTYQSQVSRWLVTDAVPKWEYLLRIARHLEVTVDYLIDDSQDEFPKDPEVAGEDKALIALIKALDLSTEEAFRRLMSISPASTPRTIRLAREGGA